MYLAGQGSFSSIANAQAEVLNTTGLPFAEFIVCYRITWLVNTGGAGTGKCSIASVQAISGNQNSINFSSTQLTFENQGVGVTQRNTINLTDTFLNVADDLTSKTNFNVNWENLKYWLPMPTGTAYGSNNFTITIPDVANANNFQYKFSIGTVVRWTEGVGGTVRSAVVGFATYSTNLVTLLIGQNNLTANATAFQFTYEKCNVLKLNYNGLISSTGTNICAFWEADKPYLLSGVRGRFETGGTGGSGNYVFDVNVNGTSVMTNKLTIAYNSTSSDHTINNLTVLNAGDIVTIDCDTVATAPTTYAQNVQFTLYLATNNNLYLKN
jgi:hypothetical protein